MNQSIALCAVVRMPVAIGTLQDRLQRCAMDCQDKVRDKVGPKTAEPDVARYRGELESCVVKCGDSHIALVPNMMKRIKEVLQQHQKQQQ